MYDVLVIGAGPAGTALAAALNHAGLRVAGLTSADPAAPWINNYGIWADELDHLDLPDVFSHRWTDCSAYMHGPEIPIHRTYAIFDNARLQAHLLGQCAAGGMTWHRGTAAGIEHSATHATVTTEDGATIAARLVVDASGHFPALVRRPAKPDVAYQAAYGIRGRFSTPPVRPGQLVLMDYRADHLTDAERRSQPPTFLYALDLGDDVYFVEETSLANAPAVSLEILKDRLYRRLAHRGIVVTEEHHIEKCLFPMNLPLPDTTQPVLGYGGAASMVHPASGYQVGAALKRAPGLAAAITNILDRGYANPGRAAWSKLWPSAAIRNRNLYLFGLECIMRFDERTLHDFFTTFFALPHPQWTGYLSNTLSTPELSLTMLNLFGMAPTRVQSSLVLGTGSHPTLLWKSLAGVG
jgi:lycopene beta-cyclase